MQSGWVHCNSKQQPSVATMEAVAMPAFEWVPEGCENMLFVPFARLTNNHIHLGPQVASLRQQGAYSQ